MNQKANSRRRPATSSLIPTVFNGFSIAVANRQRRQSIDKARLKLAVAAVLQGEGVDKADVSIAVVNDVSIHQINRQFLQHDEPTDVISFVLDQANGFIDGEIIVSADTAATMAKQYGWSIDEELLLYVIHGALHLTGYDDLVPNAKRKMRMRERHYLKKMGVKLPSTKSQSLRSK